MNIKQQLTLVAALLLEATATAIAQQNSDTLKQRLLTQAQSLSADDYAFTRTVHTEQTSNGKTQKKVAVEKFDPAKPADARWTLVSVDGAAPTADALKDFKTEAAKRRVPGYYRLADYFKTAATTTSDSHNRTVFHFAALPKDAVKVMDTDVSQNASAEVSVGEASDLPFAEQVRIVVKPMRIKLLMKLETFESSARYRIGPEGKPLLVEQTSDMSGSGMGQQGTFHTSTTYSDYQLVKAR